MVPWRDLGTLLFVTAWTAVMLASGGQRSPGTLLDILDARDSPSPIKNDLAQEASHDQAGILLGEQGLE